MAKIYILIEMNDDYDFGERRLTAFQKKEDAISAMRASAEEDLGVDFDDMEDYFKEEEEDYVLTETEIRAFEMNWAVDELEIQ